MTNNLACAIKPDIEYFFPFLFLIKTPQQYRFQPPTTRRTALPFNLPYEIAHQPRLELDWGFLPRPAVLDSKHGARTYKSPSLKYVKNRALFLLASVGHPHWTTPTLPYVFAESLT
jgi:hypothetical protein